jgi:hypothetical protein
MAVQPGARSGIWVVSWRIANIGSARLDVHSAWLPHDHFNAKERALKPALSLGPAESVELGLPAACADPPGAEIENAYVILRATSQGRAWRIFARLRVTLQPDGSPRVLVERVSVQPVGYAEQRAE